MIKHEESDILRRRARVKWFHARRGYGFLEDPALQGDIFVHHSAIDCAGYRLLDEGEEVEYELDPTPASPHAHRALRVKRTGQRQQPATGVNRQELPAPQRQCGPGFPRSDTDASAG